MDVIGKHEIAEAETKSSTRSRTGSSCCLERCSGSSPRNASWTSRAVRGRCWLGGRSGSASAGRRRRQRRVSRRGATARGRTATDRLEFVEADAGNYEAEPGSFDVASYIGATWICGGLARTLELMRRPLYAGGLLFVGAGSGTNHRRRRRSSRWSAGPASTSLQAHQRRLRGLLGRVFGFPDGGGVQGPPLPQTTHGAV